MLPQLDLTEEQSANIVAAFGGEEPYREWLRTVLRSEIERRAVRAAADALNAEVAQAVAAAVTGAGLSG